VPYTTSTALAIEFFLKKDWIFEIVAADKPDLSTEAYRVH
jgi:hypothetical protein